MWSLDCDPVGFNSSGNTKTDLSQGCCEALTFVKYLADYKCLLSAWYFCIHLWQLQRAQKES